MNLKYKNGIIFIISFMAFFYIFGYIISIIGINISPLNLNTNLIATLIAIIITIACSTVVSMVTSRFYYKSQLRKLKLDDPQFNEAIKSLIKEKSEISMSDLFNLFSSGNNNKKDVEFRKRLNKKIFSWVSKYDFSIQGDKIILTTDNITAFMDELDKSFNEWYRKNKPKKI